MIYIFWDADWSLKVSNLLEFLVVDDVVFEISDCMKKLVGYADIGNYFAVEVVLPDVLEFGLPVAKVHLPLILFL